MLKYCIPLLLIFSVFESMGQVSGTVFIDFNSNGVKNNTTAFNEPGYGGVSVTGYGADGTTYGPTTTAADGTYTLAGVNQSTRIEFSWSGNWLEAGVSGNTSLQFVNGSSIDIDLGLNYIRCFTDDNSEFIIPCYINGDPLPGGSTSGGYEALVKFTNNAVGVKGVNEMPVVLATAADIGSTYGVAFRKKTSDIFTSAFLKRHVGFGPDGPGAIYKVNNTTGVISTFLNFADYSISVGTIGDNVTRGLLTDPTEPSTDTDAFAKVFKMSFGDLEISDDEDFLYVTNLFDRLVYKISIADIENGTAAYQPEALSMPAINCISGVARPFGLGFNQGSLYAAYTCTGENSGGTADLVSEIFKYDPVGNSWSSSVLSVPLDYPRGAVKESIVLNNNPWTDDPNDITVDTYQNYPQVILSDIEFDYEGSMHLGLRDRLGDMVGFKNSDMSGTVNDNWNANAGGDILRTYWNGTNFVLESNGVAGPYTSTGTAGGTNNGDFNIYVGPGGPNSDQGPGGGEFYWEDNFFENASRGYVHSEVSSGSIASICGSNEIITNVFDPLDGRYYAGGVHWYDITNGSTRIENFELYNSGYKTEKDDGVTFGKANGLGDIELLSSLPPLEIGNRIWKDTDNDGVQDADEIGIDGVEIELVEDGNVVASTISTNGGLWYFNESNVTDGVKANTDYIIRVKTALDADALAGCTAYTTKDAATGGIQDLGDSDAATDGTIAYQTGEFGANDHSLDIGVIEACVDPTATASATDATCSGVTANSDATITIAAFTSGQRYQYSSGGTFGTGIPASITAIPAGGVIVNDLANAAATYTVRIYDASDETCFVDRVVNIEEVICTTPCTTPNCGNVTIIKN